MGESYFGLTLPLHTVACVVSITAGGKRRNSRTRGISCYCFTSRFCTSSINHSTTSSWTDKPPNQPFRINKSSSIGVAVVQCTRTRTGSSTASVSTWQEVQGILSAVQWSQQSISPTPVTLWKMLRFFLLKRFYRFIIWFWSEIILTVSFC